MTLQSRAAQDATDDLIDLLSRARNSARDLNIDRAYDLAGDRNLAVASAIARAIALNLARALDRARNRDLALDLARNLNLDRIRALDLSIAFARNFDRAYDPDLDFDLNLARAVDLARARAVDLADDLARAHTLTLGILASRVTARLHLSRRQEEIAPLAGRLTAVAVRLLPATDRDRYKREFRSELWELAQASQRRRRQLGYGLRQLRSALFVRAVLTAPSPRRASP